jgi:hypothetical protein
MLPLLSGALLSLSAAQPALASDNELVTRDVQRQVSSIEAHERYVRGGPALDDRRNAQRQVSSIEAYEQYVRGGPALDDRRDVQRQVSSIEAYEQYVRGGPALGDRRDIDVANRTLAVVR